VAVARSRVLLPGGVGAAGLLAAIAAWAAFAPLPAGPREVVYVIPKGTAVQQSLGASPSVLPAVMRFTLGVRDVLVLRNEDDVPATFGPVRLEPGQTYRVPFHAPTAFQLACSVHRDGAVGIVVSAPPRPGWERLRWRAMNLTGS
jgi:hypothetical protein